MKESYFPYMKEILEHEKDPIKVDGKPFSIIKTIEECDSEFISVRFEDTYEELIPYGDGVYFMTSEEYLNYIGNGGSWYYIEREDFLKGELR